MKVWEAQARRLVGNTDACILRLCFDYSCDDVDGWGRGETDGYAILSGLIG
jgi:hypothetical protein